MRAFAVEQCLADLVTAAGLPAGTAIQRVTESGRRWPRDFVGSVTDKGTVVAAAMASRSVLQALGIDIEREERRGSQLDAALVGTGGGPPRVDEPLATLMTFSVKEAVFKAQFAETRTQLRYTDIEIDWTVSAEAVRTGTARCAGLDQLLHVRCSASRPWVVAVAFVERFA
jgi:4'-phosphopantetheinyl transferase EntD